MFYLILFLIALNIFLFYRKIKSSYPENTEWEIKVAYAKLNKEIFQEASDEEKHDLIYYYIQRLRKKDDYGEKSLKKLPDLLKTYSLIHELEMEVNNGGYFQFFTNSSGKYVNETIDSLEKIEAKHTKQYTIKAFNILTKYGETTENLNSKLNKFKLNEIFIQRDLFENEDLFKELEEIDNLFFEYREDISKLNLSYFEKHQEELWSELG